MKSRTTTQTVPVSGALANALLDWLTEKPARPFLFLDPTVSGFSNDRGNKFALESYDAGFRLATVLGKGDWRHFGGWHLYRHGFTGDCATRNVDLRFIDRCGWHPSDDKRRRSRQLFPDLQKQAFDIFISGERAFWLAC